MGWQSRKKQEREKELNRVLTKEEKEEIKRKYILKKEVIRKEIKEPIKNIDDRVSKSNVNLLFLLFRPVLFIAVGLLVMIITQSYEFSANKKIWPMVFVGINILTILLMIPLMRMQRLSFKNVFKYKEKSFKWWQYILIVVGLLLSFVVFSIISELIAYGTFLEKTTMLIQSQFKIADYFLLILLPLTTILAEDFFFYGYVSNTVKDNYSNFAIITIFAIAQHALFPFSLDLLFMGYRMLSMIMLWTLFTLLYRKTKNLIPIVIAHTILNLITMISIVMI